MPASKQPQRRQHAVTGVDTGAVSGGRIAEQPSGRDRGSGTLDTGLRARPRGAIAKKPGAWSTGPRTFERDADAPASAAGTVSNGDASTEERVNGGHACSKSVGCGRGATAVVQPRRQELRELFGLGQGEACSPLDVALLLLLHRAQ
jgi:hypothetical protein